GQADRHRGNYTSALEHYHRAMAVHEELGNRGGVASVTICIGNVLKDTGDNPAALEHYHRALGIIEEAGKHSSTSLVIGNIGSVHLSIGNYPAALEHFHRALAMHEERGEHTGVARVTAYIGNVYFSTGNYPAALEHYHHALSLYEEIGSLMGAVGVISAIGAVHNSIGNHAAALEHFHRALAAYEELGVRSGVVLVTGNIITVLISSEFYDEAEELLQTLDAMQIDDPVIVVQREISRTSLQKHHGNNEDAAATLMAALEIAREHSLLAKQAEVHKALRDLALLRNDLAGYVEYNNEFTRITEEVNGKDTASKLAMQEAERRIASERQEHEKHLAILHSTLPKHIADRVARGETVNDHYDNAAVLFMDIVGFTTISDQLSSDQVVRLLEQVFTTLDTVCEKHDVMKIKTIGDSYMAVAFPHSVRNDSPLASHEGEEGVIPSEARDEVCRAANAAIDMLHAVSHIVSPTGSPIQVRLGVHCGAVTAGVIGTSRMQYDVWGDTVNVASRMESTSEAGRIHVSEAFASALKTSPPSPLSSMRGGTSSPFPVPRSLRERGALEIKGKGTMTTYWLESPLT
ncbi:MAG: hypothetical protein EHM43_08310, partial [Ignavibacteriae bacterium]